MNCQDFQDNLAGRMDDLLVGPQRGQFDSHVAACARCAELWRDQELLRSRLDDLARSLGGSPQTASILARAAAGTTALPRRGWAAPARWLGMAAAAAIIALAVGLLPWPWAGHDAAKTAWAVAMRVQDTRSVRMEMQFRGPDGTIAARGAILSTPERARIEEADGRIGVGEFASGRGIAIDPASRTVIAWEGRLEIPNLYQVFRELRPADGVAPGAERLDGRRTLVFSARVLYVDARVWVDAETLLPVRLEYPMQLPINGALVAGTAVATNIAWDVPIDETLLSLEPPAGYEVRSRPAFTMPPANDPPPPAPVVEVRDGSPESFAGTVETRLRNLILGALQYAARPDPHWPHEISQIAPYIHTGTLHNPDRPQYEIGFVYIRPSGPLHWADPQDKVLIFYERFEEWPGSVRVSYTDGTVERIDDRERFDRLVAEARRRAAGD